MAWKMNSLWALIFLGFGPMLADTMLPTNGRNPYHRQLNAQPYGFSEIEAAQQRRQQAQGAAGDLQNGYQAGYFAAISAVSTNSFNEFDVPQSRNRSIEYVRAFQRGYKEGGQFALANARRQHPEMERFNMLDQQQRQRRPDMLPPLALAASQFQSAQHRGIHSALHDQRLRQQQISNQADQSNAFIGGGGGGRGGRVDGAFPRQELWSDQRPIPAVYNPRSAAAQAFPSALYRNQPAQVYPASILQQQQQQQQNSLYQASLLQQQPSLNVNATEFVPSSRNLPAMMPTQPGRYPPPSAGFSPYHQEVQAPTPISPVRRYNQWQMLNNLSNSAENALAGERQMNPNEDGNKSKLESGDSSKEQQIATEKEKSGKNKEKEAKQKGEDKPNKSIVEKGKVRDNIGNVIPSQSASRNTRITSRKQPAPSFARVNNPGRPRPAPPAPNFLDYLVAAKPKSKKNTKGKWNSPFDEQFSGSMGNIGSGSIPKSDAPTGTGPRTQIISSSSTQQPIGSPGTSVQKQVIGSPLHSPRSWGSPPTVVIAPRQGSVPVGSPLGSSQSLGSWGGSSPKRGPPAADPSLGLKELSSDEEDDFEHRIQHRQRSPDGDSEDDDDDEPEWNKE